MLYTHALISIIFLISNALQALEYADDRISVSIPVWYQLVHQADVVDGKILHFRGAGSVLQIYEYNKIDGLKINDIVGEIKKAHDIASVVPIREKKDVFGSSGVEVVSLKFKAMDQYVQISIIPLVVPLKMPNCMVITEVNKYDTGVFDKTTKIVVDGKIEYK